jgi:hypothetical protein
MTEKEKKAATSTKPRQPQRHVPDPTFEVCTDRPKDIVTARGVNVPPLREHRPLTAAVLKTAENGGSVQIKYAKEDHDRLMGRFKGLESRLKTLRFKYSLVLDEDKKATHVRYWAEKVGAAPVEALPPEEHANVQAPGEPVVGRDVE